MFFCTESYIEDLSALLEKFALQMEEIPLEQSIPGSFWGDEEAGLVANKIYYRSDTPVHSLLHEACHYICMDQQRREHLHTDASGDYDEENGVCYLQIVLCDYLDFISCEQMMSDMDEWGYSFRLGSASKWYYYDSDEARQWLIKHQLLNEDNQPLWQNRLS